MIALIQRVTNAHVVVNNQVIGDINKGIVALIGVQKDDQASNAERLLERLLGYRIFPDQNQKMNLSVSDIQASLLIIPQFTLAADTSKGRRPSFSSCAPPHEGQKLFDYLVTLAKSRYAHVATGEFAADMQVNLCNDGPVTFWLSA